MGNDEKKDTSVGAVEENNPLNEVENTDYPSDSPEEKKPSNEAEKKAEPLSSVEEMKLLSATGIREQASETVVRNKNKKFIDFKDSFLDSVDCLKEQLNSVFTGKTIDINEIYNISEGILAGVDIKVNVFLYLNAIYSSDKYVAEHCMRVGLLANVFSKWLGLDSETTKDATIAGFLHDIGMLEVPQKIMEKSEDLTAQEWDMLRAHTKRGVMMLSSKGIDSRILEVVRSHHERFDGSGYPNGKKQNEITQLTSIISIVDIYDSMTSNRPYRAATCAFDTIDFIEKNMLHKLNPKLLYVFIENIPHIYNNSLVKLSNGEKARVVFINKNNKTSPIVQLEHNNELVDLSKSSNLKIIRIL